MLLPSVDTLLKLFLSNLTLAGKYKLDVTKHATFMKYMIKTEREISMSSTPENNFDLIIDDNNN